jgi:hypothetical protein
MEGATEKMDLQALIVSLPPPERRVSKCSGEFEQHLPEAASMLAYAMHLLRTLRTVG